jgi:hypothetical protein
MLLDKELYNEINEYCKLNSLKTRDFIYKILKEAFLKEKYGDAPFFSFKKEKKTEVDDDKTQYDNKIDIIEEIETISVNELTNEKPDRYEVKNMVDDVKPQPKKKRKLH